MEAANQLAQRADASHGALPLCRDFVLLPWRGRLPEMLRFTLTQGATGKTLSLRIGGQTHTLDTAED